jgi:hypothetical protein
MVMIEQLVPQAIVVSEICKAIGFVFTCDEVDHRYCKNDGHLALEPIRLFKIILFGYLFGIKSE